jgi:hypothetical protein
VAIKVKAGGEEIETKQKKKHNENDGIKSPSAGTENL